MEAFLYAKASLMGSSCLELFWRKTPIPKMGKLRVQDLQETRDAKCKT